MRKESDIKTPVGSEFEEDDIGDLEEGAKITVGICAMNKKVETHSHSILL